MLWDLVLCGKEYRTVPCLSLMDGAEMAGSYDPGERSVWEDGIFILVYKAL